jgi:hypothetical protein
MITMPPTKKQSDAKPAEPEWITRSIRFPADVLAAVAEDARKHRRKTNDHLLWIVERYLSGVGNNAE